MKRKGLLAALILVGALTVPTASAAAGAEAGQGPPKAAKRSCQTIDLGGPKIFTKHNMRCQKAKHYARRLYKTEGRDEPRRFKCSSGSNFQDGGFCRHKSKNKYFGWHPAD